ncbi:helicase RepA family protein [Aquisalimonas lutea]|uniref:helicase RepA family protein n=1 Tax=Aquisalimonas lutea TaxID=1327750 RepID=UPI0025B4B30A|nr:helicase RepA family protein [Aquisalimonas lutea]MDN3518319.1 helicase RepA family protein [Aquisalimonas lutea]
MSDVKEFPDGAARGANWLDEKAAELAGDGADKPPARFELVKAADIEPKAPSWLIRDYLEADTLALVFGDPGCGKSFLAVDWACSVATGKDYQGQRVKHGPVVYLAGEGLNGLARRRKAWTIRHQQSLEDAPLYVSKGPAALCDWESALAVQKAVDDLAEAEGSPALIVVDTLARNFGSGDENSTQDMNIAVQVMDALRTAHRATVLVIHHTGHGDKSRGRGAMALKGALDAEYRMDKDEQGVVRLEATKMKDAPEPEPWAFRIRSVELGFQDEDGHEVTSAVLDSTDYTPPQHGQPARGKNQRIALALLERLEAEHRANVEADGRDPDTARVSVDAWRSACVAEGMDRRRFHQVKDSLNDHHAVVMDHGFVRSAVRPSAP